MVSHVVQILFRSLCISLLLSCSFACAESTTETKTAKKSESKSDVPVSESKPTVTMDTTLGTVVIELYPEKSPLTVKNFLAYVKSGHYDGTIFHRIIPNFMAQGGGYDTKLRKKATNAPVVNESDNKLQNDRGTIAMARTMDPDSATAQFFINYLYNHNLDWSENNPGYTVFGKVIKGMDVVDAMAEQPQGNAGGPFVNAPNVPIVIKSVKLNP